jgi:tetratricopeptide (TPR) repeat protein
MIKVALAMIVKGSDDEAALLDKCLKSVKGHVDGIFIDVNAPKGKKPSKKVLDVAKKYTKNVRQTVWANNFVQARNDNFASVPEEFTHILWLDADDTIDVPKKIREVASVMPTNVDGVYINYNYAHDEYGNVTVSHYVARLVRNNGTFAWKSSFSDADVTVHETLNEVRSVGKAMNEEFSVTHHADNTRQDNSLIRNIKLLEGMYEKDTENVDPRILFYLATHYYDANMLDRCKVLLERYLTMSGWAEERSQAWVYLGDIYQAYKDYPKARGCYSKALAENPSDPSAYVELGELDMKDQLWEKSIEWLEMAVSKKVDPKVVIQRPLENSYRAYKALAEANVQLGQEGIKKAAEWLEKALALRPFDKELLQARELVAELEKTANMNEALATIARELLDTKETYKVLPLLNWLPKTLQESPVVHGLRRKFTKPTMWPDKSVAIMCGPSALGHWGPWSIEEGIGGSEEAVIQLSQELTKLGYAVTVYATPGPKAGVINGVTWKHYWEFNQEDSFDVLIGWRSPSMFDKKYSARKQYLWLHDVIDTPELTPERVANIDKIIFVSQYHADLYPEIADDKKLASGNGIDPTQFEQVVERNPKKVIYMSAHERGQDLLQRIWNDVVAEVPDAELHCYYGWDGYNHVNRNNPERMEWKNKLVADQKRLKNFTDHGKISHKEIAKTILSAGVWAYPTGFPEVYCITGVKAQAGGAWPVYSNFAALKETVHFGDKIQIEENEDHVGKWSEDRLEEFKQLLISRLKNPASEKVRQAMMKWAQTNMSWEKTAKEWSDEFKSE